MSTSQEQLNSKVQRATARLVQLQARQALQDMRRQVEQRALMRRQAVQRREELSEAVVEAGLGSWSKAELIGLLLRAREQFGDSDVTRRILAQHERDKRAAAAFKPQ